MNQTITTEKKSNHKVFGTHEWAVKTVNFITGCQHDCKYCYSKEMAIRFKRKTKNTWKNETVRETIPETFKKIDGTIMFPSSHDIHPCHIDETINVIEKLLVAGNQLLIVTKPHYECITAICEIFHKYKEKILFRFTIGSADSEILKFWEPGAPDFKERISALKYAYNEGFQTSVSCEPMLDNNIDEVVEKALPYVTDSIWLGKANYLIKRLKLNGYRDRQIINKAEQLLEWQSDENVKSLYNKYKNTKKIKWKESIKSVVGIEIPTTKGLDI